MQEKLEDLLEYVKADGRICPNPQEWNTLWEMLPDKRYVGSGWEPPLPLILAAWWDTLFLAKISRLEEHIRFADKHNVLEEVDTYLRGLKAEQWFYG